MCLEQRLAYSNGCIQVSDIIIVVAVAAAVIIIIIIITTNVLFPLPVVEGLQISYKMKEKQKNMDEKQTDVQKLMTEFSQKCQDSCNVRFAKVDPGGGHRTSEKYPLQGKMDNNWMFQLV